MLTARELATLRAALLFWREEMSDAEVMRPYYDVPAPDPLTPEETEELRTLLLPPHVRYGIYDTALQQLASRTLFDSAEAALAVTGPTDDLVTVLLPASHY